MYTTLNIGNLGFAADLPTAAAMAARHGFAAVDFSIAEAAELVAAHGVAYVRDLFTQHNLRPGAWSLPFDFRAAAAAWRAGLEELPALAALAAELGSNRTGTYIMPCDNDRDFAANFAFHVERLKPLAAILADHGHRFALEFVGPRTVRVARRHSFVYTQDGVQALAAAVGDNVGLLVDSYHVFTSHGRMDDLLQLANRDVVMVHVNDAMPDVPVDELPDLARALPGETGVLDLAGFVAALSAIGYDGPVAVEPFSARLRALPMESAVAETGASLASLKIDR